MEANNEYILIQGLGNSTIVIHCHDSRSTVVITIVLFTIVIVVELIFEQTSALYRIYFMQLIVQCT